MTDQLPSKDLVSRLRLAATFLALREPKENADDELMREAADEIERLQRELVRISAEREPPHCSNCGCGLAPEPPAEWQPIETSPRDEEAMFWIRPLTKDEAWCNTSGEPIVIDSPPELFVGKRGRWSSLWTATHWMPLPSGPSQPPRDGQ